MIIEIVVSRNYDNYGDDKNIAVVVVLVVAV
jgi:hypothetical protein